jgi:hypothetical protein
MMQSYKGRMMQMKKVNVAETETTKQNKKQLRLVR